MFVTRKKKAPLESEESSDTDDGSKPKTAGLKLPCDKIQLKLDNSHTRQAKRHKTNSVANNDSIEHREDDDDCLIAVQENDRDNFVSTGESKEKSNDKRCWIQLFKTARIPEDRWMKYIEYFMHENMQYRTRQRITELNLSELGIDSVGDKLAIMDAICEENSPSSISLESREEQSRCKPIKLTRNTKNIGASSFLEIIGSDFYIDKSMFIKSIFDLKAKIVLLTSPPHFGKTMNLTMLKEFVEQKMKQDGSSYHKNAHENVFKNTKLWNDVKIREHFRRYIVIHMDLSGSAADWTDAIDSLAASVRSAYLKHVYLEKSSKIMNDKTLAANIKLWFEDDPIIRDAAVLKKGLSNLLDCLRAHHGEEMNYICIIDEFDNLVSKAMFALDEKNLNCITHLLDAIMSPLKHGDDIMFSVIVGVADITSVCGSLNNEVRIAFLQNEMFAPYFGITIDEFDELSRKHQIDDETKHMLLNRYNGYCCGEIKVLSYWLLIEFLMNRQSIEDNYFIRKNLVDQLGGSLCQPIMEEAMKKLLSGRSIAFRESLTPSLKTKDLHSLALICKCKSKSLIKETLLIQILFQFGFLSRKRKKGSRRLIVPNAKAMSALKTLYYSYFERNYLVSRDKILMAANSFPTSFRDGKIPHMENFCSRFHELLATENLTFTLNHQLIHATAHLIVTETKRYWKSVGHECPITEIGHVNRCDVMLCSADTLIIIEIKFKESINAAMRQIINQRYQEVLQNKKIIKNPEAVKYVVRFGLAVKETLVTEMKLELVDRRNDKILDTTYVKWPKETRP